MKINICGMPHEIKHVTCGFQSGMCGEDEALVCSMANAVNQAFELRLED